MQDIENQTVKERLKSFIKHKKISVRAFESTCGLSYGFVGNMRNSMQPSKVTKIAHCFPELNMGWLLTGEGEMLKNKEKSNAEFIGFATPALQEQLAQVRFFDLKPSASFREFCSSGSEEPEAMSLLPERNETLTDEHCIFIVHGDSMEPQIHSKAKVLCVEIKPTKWHMVDGVVVIAYADRFVIKRVIKNRLATENYILLGSDNPDFPEQERAPLCDIRCIFRACRILSQQIS